MDVHVPRAVTTALRLRAIDVLTAQDIAVDDAPRDLVLVTADVPARVSRIVVSAKQLSANWRQSPPPPDLAAIGDGFVIGGRAAILIVPSVLAPAESNWLVNPRHADFARIRVHPPEEFSGARLATLLLL
jgi:RES domain-containing protein